MAFYLLSTHDRGITGPQKIKEDRDPFPVATMEKWRVGRSKTGWEAVNGRTGRNGFRTSAEKSQGRVAGLQVQVMDLPLS